MGTWFNPGIVTTKSFDEVEVHCCRLDVSFVLCFYRTSLVCFFVLPSDLKDQIIEKEKSTEDEEAEEIR